LFFPWSGWDLSCAGDKTRYTIDIRMGILRG
jgi:hypothetical protein